MTAAELEASILDLAIRGKLVPQDPNDESAEMLLERIRSHGGTETRREGRAPSRPKNPGGRTRRSATLPPISDDEKPFDLPKNWTWCRLGGDCA